MTSTPTTATATLHPLLLVKFFRKTIPGGAIASYNRLGVLVVKDPRTLEFRVDSALIDSQHVTKWTLTHLHDSLSLHVGDEWSLLQHVVIAAVVASESTGSLVLRQRWRLADVLTALWQHAPSLAAILAETRALSLPTADESQPAIVLPNSGCFPRYYCIFRMRNKVAVTGNTLLTVRPVCDRGLVVGTLDSDAVVARSLMSNSEQWVGQVALILNSRDKEVTLYEPFQVTSAAPLLESPIWRAVMRQFSRIPMVFGASERDPDNDGRSTAYYVLLQPDDFANAPFNTTARFAQSQHFFCSFYEAHRLDCWAWHFLQQGRADSVKLARSYAPDPHSVFGVTVLGTVQKHSRFTMVRQLYRSQALFQQIREFDGRKPLRHHSRAVEPKAVPRTMSVIPSPVPSAAVPEQGGKQKDKKDEKEEEEYGPYCIIGWKGQQPPFLGSKRAGRLDSNWLRQQALHHLAKFPDQCLLYKVFAGDTKSLKDECGTVLLTDSFSVNTGHALEHFFPVMTSLLANVPKDWGRNRTSSACSEATLVTKDQIGSKQGSTTNTTFPVTSSLDNSRMLCGIASRKFFVMVYEALLQTKKEWRVVYPVNACNCNCQFDNMTVTVSEMAHSQVGDIWTHRYFEPVRRLYWQHLLRPLCYEIQHFDKHQKLRTPAFPVPLYSIHWPQLKNSVVNRCAATIDSNYLLQLVLLAMFRHTSTGVGEVGICSVLGQQLVGRSVKELEPHKCLMLHDDFAPLLPLSNIVTNPLLARLQEDNKKLRGFYIVLDKHQMLLVTPANFPSRHIYDTLRPTVQQMAHFDLSSMTTCCDRNLDHLRLLALEYMRRGIEFKMAKLTYSSFYPDYVVLSSGTIMVEGVDDPLFMQSIVQLYHQERFQRVHEQIRNFNLPTLNHVFEEAKQRPFPCELFLVWKLEHKDTVPAMVELSSATLCHLESPTLRSMVELALLSPDHDQFYFGQAHPDDLRGLPSFHSKGNKKLQFRVLNSMKVDDKFAYMREDLEKLPLLQVDSMANCVMIMPDRVFKIKEQFKQNSCVINISFTDNIFPSRTYSKMLAWAALHWMRQGRDAKTMFFGRSGRLHENMPLILEGENINLHDSVIGNIWTSPVFEPVRQLFRQEQARQIANGVMKEPQTKLKSVPPTLCCNSLAKQQLGVPAPAYMLVSLKDCQILAVSNTKTFTLQMNRVMQNQPLLSLSLSSLVEHGKKMDPWIAGRLQDKLWRDRNNDSDKLCVLHEAFMSWETGRPVIY